MSVIDFHSHVLPRIDDGSHSSEESLGMLQISASQGIDVMAATSHFYATEDRISSSCRDGTMNRAAAGIYSAG